MKDLDSRQLKQQIEFIALAVHSENADYMKGFHAAIDSVGGLINYLSTKKCDRCKHSSVIRDMRGHIIGRDCKEKECKYESR